MTDEAPPIIRLEDVYRAFRAQPVLIGLSAAFPTGLTTVVLGASGCGKSVMLRHLVGLLRPDRGAVWYGDHRIDRMSERAIAPLRLEFGFLFQHSALFDSWSVAKNVAFPLVEHSKFNPAQQRERVRHVLGLVGMADAVDKMPSDLSGGQRKRVALARAIVLEPKVILYDEPTTGLDPIRADTINGLIVKLKDELGATSIVVTHDLTSAFRIADRMMMMHDGRVRLEGTPDEFLATDDPIVRRFLLGEATVEDIAPEHSRPPTPGFDVSAERKRRALR